MLKLLPKVAYPEGGNDKGGKFKIEPALSWVTRLTKELKSIFDNFILGKIASN